MKHPIRVLGTLALGGAMTLLTAAPASAAPNYDATPFWTGQRPLYTEQHLATNGEGGFPNYRIPALAVTNAGTVLAAYDGRPTSIDAPGPNSILERRSSDNGATWSPQTAIHAGQAQAPVEGFSDPSYVVDRDTGTVFNFHVHSYDVGFAASQPGVDPAARNVLHAEVSTSTDDGVTWTHRDITPDITPDLGVRSRFAASGQGIQLRYGPYAGRLLQQYTIIAADGSFKAVSIYSDDHGATWHAGQPVGVGMDENKTVELSDGTVMLNSRDSQRSGYRKVAYSHDGGLTYGPVSIEKQLPDPANNASIIRAFPNAPEGSAEAKVLLFSNAASSTSRSNGTIRASCDDGRTWPIAKVFQSGSMSYSTLATLPDGNVGLLYEPSDGIAFATFNLAWLGGMCSSIQTASPLTIGRGSSGSTTLTVTNQLGPVVKGATLTAAAPAGWTVSFAGQPGKLQPGADWTTQVTVNVPASATGGTYTIPVTLTDATGRAAQGTITVIVPKIESEIDGRITVTVAQTNAKASYAVGDKLTFTYRVTNLTGAVTTVVPSGNLQGLDPATSKQNCRWINLPGRGAYSCYSAYHIVTQADLDAGSFTPQTTWVSTSGEDVTTVKVDGPTVKLT